MVLKTLIINADDFGLTNCVNEAVIDAFQSGCLTSTTLMVNTVGTEEAIMMAKKNPGLAVGLHFNLTLGKPVSDVSNVTSLVNKFGEFYSRSILMRRLMCGIVKRSDIDLELDAQYKMMQVAGLNPSHIDSHQHLHGFPLVFDSVAAQCEKENIPVRMPWVLNLKAMPVTPGRRLKQWVLKKMLDRNAKHWKRRIRWNTALASIFDLGTIPEKLEVDHYRKLLEDGKEGIYELMVHPGKDAKELAGLTRIGHVSESEWAFLTSGALLPLLSELDFTLGSYRNIDCVSV